MQIPVYENRVEFNIPDNVNNEVTDIFIELDIRPGTTGFISGIELGVCYKPAPGRLTETIKNDIF